MSVYEHLRTTCIYQVITAIRTTATRATMLRQTIMDPPDTDGITRDGNYLSDKLILIAIDNTENDKKRESLTSNPSPKGKGSNVFRSSSYHIYLSLRIASLAFWKEIRGKAFSFLHLYLI